MILLQVAAIPNIISLSRIFLGISFFYLYPSSIAIPLLLVGAFSDVLDGYIARQFGLCSSWGEVIDPISDKIFWMMVVSRLYLSNITPKWFFYSMLMRDMLFFSAFIFMFLNKINNFKANWSGKLTAVAICITILFSLYNNCSLCMKKMYIICVIFICVNIWDYAKRLI